MPRNRDLCRSYNRANSICVQTYVFSNFCILFDEAFEKASILDIPPSVFFCCRERHDQVSYVFGTHERLGWGGFPSWISLDVIVYGESFGFMTGR